MKTSFKILIPTILLMFIMLFAVYFNVRAEINKYVSGEISIKQNKLESFNNIVLNTKKSVSLFISDKNIVYGDIDMNNYKIINDTLYVSDSENIRIDFKNLNSIISVDKADIFIDSLYNNRFEIGMRNNSGISVRKGTIKNLIVNCDSSRIYINNNCYLSNIEGELKNNSFLKFNSRINSIKIKSDTSSFFNTYGWRN